LLALGEWFIFGPMCSRNGDAMAGPEPADNRKPETPELAAAVVRYLERPGIYLTNEVFLYQVVGHVASCADEMFDLEDCYGLDVVRVPGKELHARRFRVVTPERPVTEA
jgi:hypothetical protein